MENRSARIAALNDQFRKGVGLPPPAGGDGVPGQAFMTAGINALSPEQLQQVLAKVRDFDEFTEDNDPYGEHDFGAFTLAGVGKIFWKFDYYDQPLEFGSEDPADPTVTQRVLTIMLAEE
jgi:hypothetical protein